MSGLRLSSINFHDNANVAREKSIFWVVSPFLLIFQVIKYTKSYINRFDEKVRCDGCGKEVKCDSKMDEDWIIFCAECEKELDLDFVE